MLTPSTRMGSNTKRKTTVHVATRIMMRTIVKDGLRPTIARCSQEEVAGSAPPFPIDDTCAKPLSTISFVVLEGAFKEIRRPKSESRKKAEQRSPKEGHVKREERKSVGVW